MEKSFNRNIRLGLFVLIGTSFLIYSLYMIGSRSNLFGSNFKVNAIFHNVNGLMPGNNVRFAGIDVGTVEKVQIINDTMVCVNMVLEKKVKEFIRKDAVASIGTDGLMGNKLVNVNSVADNSRTIQENDTLRTMRPIEMDDMLRTLNTTNNNLAVITDNIKSITSKINSPNSLWSLLMDTIIADNVKQAVVNIKVTGSRSAQITGDLDDIIKGIKQGRGTMGALLTDTVISGRMQQAVVSIKIAGDKVANITGDISKIVGKIDSGKGMVGRLILDTTFVPALNKSMQNIKTGSQTLDEVLEGFKHSFPLKHYFKKQEKLKEKEKKQAAGKKDSIH